MTDAASPQFAGRGSVFNLLSSGAALPMSAELGALLLRVFLGCTICWRAGISKFPLDAWFTASVAELGFPAPTLFAWLAAMSEVAGGVLLAVGLCTRPAAFFLAFTLGVAAFRVHEVPIASVFAWQHITIAYFWGYVYFLFAGAGRLSLDGVLRRRGGLAGGAAAAIVVVLSILCAMRTAPEPTEAPVADLSGVESVVLAGSFNAWSLADTPMAEASPGVWEATVSVEAPTAVEFKFVGDTDWSLAAGDADQSAERFPVAGVAESGEGVGNMAAYLPAEGAYRFRFEPESMRYGVEAVNASGEKAATE